MGRHCGYLALVAAIVSEADFVFVPEWPPGQFKRDKWTNTTERSIATILDSGFKTYFYSNFGARQGHEIVGGSNLAHRLK